MNPFFAFRFEVAQSGYVQDVLMVFVAGNALDPEAFATLIDSEIGKNLVPDQLLIVVRDPIFDNTNLELKTDSTHIATLARLGNRSAVTLIAFNHRGLEAQRALISGPMARNKVELRHFQRRAISKIFADRHGFIEATSTYHFQNPSGRHTERFIRLSNILVRGAEIAFIAFCVLRFIPPGAKIAYLDTPSLYAVVAAINDHLSSFGPRESIVADNFSSYAGMVDFPFARVDEAFVLISASSSGSMASKLVSKNGFSPDRITHLLFLGKDSSGSHLVCDLLLDAKDNPEGVAQLPAVEEAGDCRMCTSGSFAVPLHGDQFDFAGPQQNPMLITKDDGPKDLKEVIDRNAGKGIFTVGMGVGIGNPRRFEISPVALLENPEFKLRFDYALRRSVPANLGHVIAADAVSIDLAKEVVAFASGVPLLVERGDIDDIPMGSKRAVMVVAAVIESGRTLLEISRDLRSIVPEAPIAYLVGFSKSTGESRRESLARNLTQTLNPYSYDYIEIERMVLPPSAGRTAWQDELDLLIDPEIQKLAGPPLRVTIQDRIKVLRRSSQAMSVDLFLTNVPGTRLMLQPGFVFWPRVHPEGHTQADVFFTIASVLQQLRANAEKVGAKQAIKSNWFQQTVLSAGNFGRFNDDVIQASILRAASPFELNYSESVDESREMSRLIRRILGAVSSPRSGAAAEFLLALATRRMTLRPTDLQEIVAMPQTGSGMIDFLLTTCAKRLL